MKAPEKPLNDVSELLSQWRAGSDQSLIELIPRVYDELKLLASRQLRSERPNHTLQTTALVHEAFARLVGNHPGQVESRHHFFAVAAKAMRQVLIDHARTVGRKKRISPSDRISLEIVPESWLPEASSVEDLLELDRALTDLEAVEPRAARLIELIFFTGFSQREAGEILGISESTARREVATARLWLYDQLHPTTQDPESATLSR